MLSVLLVDVSEELDRLVEPWAADEIGAGAGWGSGAAVLLDPELAANG